jgi:hypothetical protein
MTFLVVTLPVQLDNTQNLSRSLFDVYLVISLNLSPIDAVVPE